MVGAAVNVTLSPVQAGFCVVLIDTLAVTFGLTVMVTLLEVAGEPVTQVREEVITQVITSLLFKEEVVRVELFVPVFPRLFSIDKKEKDLHWSEWR